MSDDFFCAFRGSSNHKDLLSRLNGMHKNIKFTSEIGQDLLALLDTHIILPQSEAESVKCNVYRKPTFTSLMFNYAAVCPLKWKFALLQFLLHRVYVISIWLSERTFQEEWPSQQTQHAWQNIWTTISLSTQTGAKIGWCGDKTPYICLLHILKKAEGNI